MLGCLCVVLLPLSFLFRNCDLRTLRCCFAPNTEAFNVSNSGVYFYCGDMAVGKTSLLPPHPPPPPEISGSATACGNDPDKQV